MVSLVEELPFAAAVDDFYMTTTCTACFATKKENTLRKCTGCKVVCYCNHTCQTNDWPDHKLECKFLKKCSPDIPNSLVRLISRIAAKIARGDKSKAFNGRTIDDLVDNKMEMLKDANAIREFEIVHHQISKYHGNKFAIDKSQLLSICGKISTNAYGIIGVFGKVLGRGLYLGISIHNHSCSPDCFVIFDGAKAIVRSPVIGMKYSSELTVFYTDTMQTRQERRENLKTQYYFDCNCNICEDCTQDQWRQSVVSTCCEDGVCLLDPTANELSCNICKQISPISVAEAVAANDELNNFLSIIKGEDMLALSHADMQNTLKCAAEAHEMFSKIFSKFHLSLVDLVRRIVSLSMMLKDQDKLRKFALSNIPAYKKYLAVGHPALTNIMKLAALYQGLNNWQTILVRRLYEEAYEMALISHGPGHKVALMIKELMNGGRPWF